MIFVDEDKRIGNLDFTKEDEELYIMNDQSFFATSYYFSDIFDEKKYQAFIKNIISAFRQSPFYGAYITHLHELGLNKDVIQSNITTNEALVELHHYPLSLYDVVQIIILKKLNIAEPLTSFSVMQELFDIHAKNWIGLVPLTATNHELVHEGELFINRWQVYGDFEQFKLNYEEYITPDLVDKIDNMVDYSNANIRSDYAGNLDFTEIKSKPKED